MTWHLCSLGRQRVQKVVSFMLPRPSPGLEGGVLQNHARIMALLHLDFVLLRLDRDEGEPSI